MYPISLKLHNWWSYEDVAVNFVGDIVGIVGPNASGKSTIIEALAYLMTGMTTRVKTRNLRWGAEKGFVEGVFSHGSRKFTLKRDIVTSACSLTFEDGTRIGKSEDVSAALEEMLDVHKKIFNGHVVIRQRHLDEPLNMRQSELSSDLQYLFRTHRCETIRELLQAKAASLTLVDHGPAMVRAETEHAQLAARLKELEVEIDAVQKKTKSVDAVAMRQTIDDWKLIASSAPVRQQAESLLELLRPSLEKAEKEAAELAASLAAAMEVMSSMDETTREASDHLRQYEAMESDRKQLCVYRSQLKEQQESVLALQSMEPPNKPPKASIEEEAEVSELAGRRNAAKKTLEELKRVGATCPTCKQSVPNHAQLMVAQREIVDALSPILAVKEKDLAYLRSCETEYTRLVSSRDAQIATLQQASAGTMRKIEQTQVLLDKNNLPDGFSADVARALLTEAAEFKAAVATNRTDTKLAAQRKESLTKQLRDAERTLKSIQKPTRMVTAAEHDAAVTQLAAYEELTYTSLKLQTELSLVSTRLHATAEDLQKFKEEQHTYARKKEFLGLLDRTRALLHRDALPRLIARSYLRGMNGALANALDQMGFPYTVTVQDDLAFLFKSPDGYDVQSDELSGGQRMMFCIAFRLAVNQQFARHLGLLILDEPTPFVDAVNVQMVAGVLSGIRKYIHAAGMRVIVVTHETALYPAFDQIIDVTTLRSAA